MKTKTEGDIPELFQQFNGNSANYQELTRAAAARASQARWPLLSAVELDQGDIPAVMDSLTGLAVVEPVLLETTLAGATTSTLETRSETRVDTIPVLHEVVLLVQDADGSDGIPLAYGSSSASEVIAPIVNIDVHADVPADLVVETPADPAAELHADAGADITTDTSADAGLAADSRPEMPAPVVLPGNTIFMAPAPYSARHFAQLERGLVARREAALAEIVVSSHAKPDESSLETLLVEAQALTVTQTVEATPVVDTVVDDTPPPAEVPVAAAALEVAASPAAPIEPTDVALPLAAAAQAVVQKAVVQKAAKQTLPQQLAVEPIAPRPAVVAPSATAAPAARQAVASPIAAAEATAARQPTVKPARVAAKPAPAKPVATPPSPAPTVAAKPVAPAVATTKPAATVSDSTPASKHAGLQPLFQRLAEPEETTTPVMSLFSRLMQS